MAAINLGPNGSHDSPVCAGRNLRSGERPHLPVRTTSVTRKEGHENGEKWLNWSTMTGMRDGEETGEREEESTVCGVRLHVLVRGGHYDRLGRSARMFVG